MGDQVRRPAARCCPVLFWCFWVQRLMLIVVMREACPHQPALLAAGCLSILHDLQVEPRRALIQAHGASLALEDLDI